MTEEGYAYNIKNNSRKPPSKAPHKNYYGGLLVIVC